jgi:hypothetical protein
LRYTLRMKSLRIVMLILACGFASQAIAQDRVEASGNTPEAAKSVKLYPNPATEFVSIKFEAPQAHKVRLSMHTIIGNAVEFEAEVVDDYEVRIRVKDFNAGVYLISVRNEETGLKGAYKFLKK